MFSLRDYPTARGVLSNQFQGANREGGGGQNFGTRSTPKIFLLELFCPPLPPGCKTDMNLKNIYPFPQNLPLSIALSLLPFNGVKEGFFRPWEAL